MANRVGGARLAGVCALLAALAPAVGHAQSSGAWAWPVGPSPTPPLDATVSSSGAASAVAGSGYSPPLAAGAQLSVPSYSPLSASDTALPLDDAPLSSERRTRCLFGGFCFGPTLTLGLLDVFGIGAQGRSDHWGIAIDYQFFQFTTRGVAVGLSLLTLEGRAFPFGNAFFLSAGVAWQRANLSRHVSYAGDSTVPPIEADLSGRINVPVLKLGVGFMARSGFIIGVDLALGVQLGANTVEFSSNLPQIQQVVDAQNRIRNRADKFVRSLPFLLQANLLRVGFLF